MNIEEYKKLAKNKIEADTLTKKVRDVIKMTKWEKQDMREGFKETFKPLIKSQDSIKKSIDEQQNATIEQLKKNQLALIDKEKTLEQLTANLLAIMSSGKDDGDGDDGSKDDGDDGGDDDGGDDGDGDGSKDDGDGDDVLSSTDDEEEEKFKENLPPTPEKKMHIKPEYFDEYLNNRETVDILKNFGYDKLPSFYFNRDNTILESVLNSVGNKISDYQNVKLKNTANFTQISQYGFTLAEPKNKNPQQKTLDNINNYNKLSSYFSQLSKLYIYKNKVGHGINIYKNPFSLLKRLELLGGSILAGNNGVVQEFSEIAHLLNQMKVITKKQLNELIETYITNI